MANGRPPGDASDRSPRRSRRHGANEEGLQALGRQMRSGEEPGRVANESGLQALGARIDAASSASKVRRSGKPKWSPTKKVVVGLVSLIVLVVAR